MIKSNLALGKRYLHRRQCVIGGIVHEAERWVRCEEITAKGAVFGRDYEVSFELTDAQIAKEIRKGYDK